MLSENPELGSIIPAQLSGKYNHNFVICFYHFCAYRLAFMKFKNPIQN